MIENEMTVSVPLEVVKASEIEPKEVNGMTAEQFLWAWFRSEMLEPREIRFEPVNYYYEALKGTMEAHEKEVLKAHD